MRVNKFHVYFFIRNCTISVDSFIIGEIPIYWLIGTLFIAFVFGLFGKKIYLWDFKLTYGRIMTKLFHIIADMEELKKPQN